MAASQRVALWKEGWAQGSFEVGMLRDSRAIACFGSKVPLDGGWGRERDLTMVGDTRRWKIRRNANDLMAPFRNTLRVFQIQQYN